MVLSELYPLSFPLPSSSLLEGYSAKLVREVRADVLMSGVDIAAVLVVMIEAAVLGVGFAIFSLTTDLSESDLGILF